MPPNTEEKQEVAPVVDGPQPTEADPQHRGIRSVCVCVYSCSCKIGLLAHFCVAEASVHHIIRTKLLSSGIIQKILLKSCRTWRFIGIHSMEKYTTKFRVHVSSI